MTLFLYALYSFVFSFLIQLVIIIICEIKNKRKQKCDENMKEQTFFSTKLIIKVIIALIV